MSAADIIPFDFEEQAVRVMMRDGDPWFVAADVCRVLELGNPSETIKRLDDDERMTLSSIEGQTGRGGARSLNVISESGLYALIFTSRKEQAKRFRKWVTSEVLPSIRRTGHFDMTPHDTPPPNLDESHGSIDGLPLRSAEMWLQMVREARLTRGTAAAIKLWNHSPLPQITDTTQLADPKEGRNCISVLRERYAAIIKEARKGNSNCEHVLSRAGLRPLQQGLFVANMAIVALRDTQWQDGSQRAALQSVPDVQSDPTTRRLNGKATRGVIVPWHHLGAEVHA